MCSMRVISCVRLSCIASRRLGSCPPTVMIRLIDTWLVPSIVYYFFLSGQSLCSAISIVFFVFCCLYNSINWCFIIVLQQHIRFCFLENSLQFRLFQGPLRFWTCRVDASFFRVLSVAVSSLRTRCPLPWVHFAFISPVRFRHETWGDVVFWALPLAYLLPVLHSLQTLGAGHTPGSSCQGRVRIRPY